jgi:hypothetical protein
LTSMPAISTPFAATGLRIVLSRTYDDSSSWQLVP